MFPTIRVDLILLISRAFTRSNCVEEAVGQILSHLHQYIFKLTQYHPNHSHHPNFGYIWEHLWVSKNPLYNGLHDTLQAHSSKQSQKPRLTYLTEQPQSTWQPPYGLSSVSFISSPQHTDAFQKPGGLFLRLWCFDSIESWVLLRSCGLDIAKRDSVVRPVVIQELSILNALW